MWSLAVMIHVGSLEVGVWSLAVMIHVGSLEVGGVVISSDDPRR